MTNLEFNQQFNQLQQKLFAFAMKLTKDKTDAKDLMQETACKAMANLHRFSPGTNFKAWVTTIMRNSFINDYRKRRTRNKVEQPIEEFVALIENQGIRSGAYSNIMMEELGQMIKSIGKRYSVPFMLFYRGYHYDEISQQLNIPIGTVKSRIFFARRKLQSLIEEEFGKRH